MKVAVVGGGWAGLAAALALRERGADVTVFDAAHQPGGRARGVKHPAFPDGIDNGQHILIGAYRASLALIEHLYPGGTAAALMRLPLQLESLDGSFALRTPRHWPAPLHALAALACARGLHLSARLQALRLMFWLQRHDWQPPPNWTVATLLETLRQGQEANTRLWHPLCVATLNTPPSAACAVLFARVLRDALSRERRDSDLLLPRCDLSALWPVAAAKQLAWHPGAAVSTLTPLAHGWRIGYGQSRAVKTHNVDAVVLAVPPSAAARLLRALPAMPGSTALMAALERFEHEAIATLYLRLTQAWRLPAPMLQLDDKNGTLPGQWVFDRAWLTGRLAVGELSLVASAVPLGQRESLAQDMEQQWRAQWCARGAGQPAPPATAARALIIEKRATFAAKPGLVRPAVRSPWPGLLLAGDWTDTGYPGVLEGAVLSGQAAAAALHEHRSR